MPDRALPLRERVRRRVKKFCFRMDRRIRRPLEALKYALVRPKEQQRFHVVSCERGAGKWAVRCIESVYSQDYDRRRVRHVFLDDESDDGTHELIEQWLRDHPDHSVEYIHNTDRKGGAANDLTGFRMAEPGSIVIEVDGDDWLPDRNVLKFFNKVYQDEDVWTTYNTPIRFDNGRYHRHPHPQRLPIPAEVIAKNAIRQYGWRSHHLHTFRAELLHHIREESLIDPKTGRYWGTRDKSVFYPMLELAGRHSRHIYRITYVYNITGLSEFRGPDYKRTPTHRTGYRIRLLPRYKPLESLSARIGSAQFEPPRLILGP